MPAPENVRRKGIQFFQKDGTLLAIVIRADASSEDKYNFLTPESGPFQLGMSFYSAGETVKNHAHLPRDIRVTRVQELIVVSRGKTRLRLYDEERAPAGEAVLETGDIVLLTAGGHGFDVLEDTKIVELKQGPYDGHAQDKVLF